jgi:hypothetical protein
MTLKEKLIKLSYERPDLRPSLAAIIKQADSVFTFDVTIPYRITVEEITALEEPNQFLFIGYVIGPGVAATSFELVINKTEQGLDLHRISTPKDAASCSFLKSLMALNLDHLQTALLSKQQTEHFARIRASTGG